MRFAVVDLETTGGRAGLDRIIEIGCVVFGDGPDVEWEALVDPGISIPPFITGLTGIDDSMVRSAPSFHQIAERVREIVGDAIFVAHNVAFDFRFLQAELSACGMGLQQGRLCTVKLARRLFPGYESYSLGNIAGALGIRMERHHRAIDDARAAAGILRKALAEQGEEAVLPLVTGFIPQDKLPVGITQAHLAKIPEVPGLLWFRGADGANLMLEAAQDLRSAAVKILTQTGRRSPLAAVRSGVVEIDWERTGCLLHAQLCKAAQLLKLKLPGNKSWRAPSDAGEPLHDQMLVFTHATGTMVIVIQKGIVKGWVQLEKDEPLEPADALARIEEYPSRGLEGVVRQHLRRLPQSGERRLLLH